METWQLITLFLSILSAVATALWVGYQAGRRSSTPPPQEKEWDFKRRRMN